MKALVCPAPFRIHVNALLFAVASILPPLPSNLPAQSPAPPCIPTNVFDVTRHGAVGDGKTMNTEAIQETIETASTAGGGVVLVPEGWFLTGPFKLASSIDLHLARGATILISDDLKNYPAAKDRYKDSITATNCPTAGTIRGLPEAPITDVTLSNVIISAQIGMKIYHAKGVRFVNSRINVESGKPLTTFNAEVAGLE